jgi:hypothetical protein
MASNFRSSLLQLLGSETGKAGATGATPKMGLYGFFNGGDDPKKKALSSFKSPTEIDKANRFAKDFAKRKNMLIGDDAWVGKEVGDPVPQFRTEDGKPYVPKQMPAYKIKNEVPDYVTKLEWDNAWGQPYYHNDYGDMVYVDKKFYNSPRFLKDKKP